MKMKLLVSLLLFSILAAQSAAADQQPRNRQQGPYHLCNVFTSDACFGIAQGDKLNMEIVTDFVLYHVSFPFGRIATIYSGFNPTLADSPGGKFERCLKPNGFENCRRRSLDDGGFEFIANREKEGRQLHVIVSGGKDGAPLVDSFLENIRSCRRSGNTIHCAP